MKKIIFIFLFVSFIPNLFSQDSSKIPLVKNKFALQFQIGSSFTLRPFQGSTISFKYHIFDKSALRFGASIMGSSDTEVKINEIDTLKSESFYFQFNLQFLQYLTRVDDVTLYTGLGPTYTRRFSKLTGPSENSWSLGLIGIFGVEWFFKNNMSLSCEYGLSVHYYEHKYNYDYRDQRVVQKGYKTVENQFNFGLSVYL